jgi:hypothetical protein
MNERYHKKVQHTHSNMELKEADTSPGVRVNPIISAAEFRTPTYALSENEFGHNSDMETLSSEIEEMVNLERTVGSRDKLIPPQESPISPPMSPPDFSVIEVGHDGNTDAMTEDYYPFPSRICARLYIFANSLRPVVSIGCTLRARPRRLSNYSPSAEGTR